MLQAQYNALGKFNLAAIERIVVSQYRHGAAFNRQRPFVDIPVVRHRRKRGGARYERIGARAAASLFPTDVTVESLFDGEPSGKALRFFHRCNEGDVFPSGGCGNHLRLDDSADGTPSLDASKSCRNAQFWYRPFRALGRQGVDVRPIG